MASTGSFRGKNLRSLSCPPLAVRRRNMSTVSEERPTQSTPPCQEMARPGQEHQLLEKFVGEWESEGEIMAPGQPPSPRQAASAAGARAARPWPAPGRPARPGIKPARAHPTADPASRTPQAAAGHAASARSPPGPGATGPAARHGCGRRSFPARHERQSRRDSHRPPSERREERNMS